MEARGLVGPPGARVQTWFLSLPYKNRHPFKFYSVHVSVSLSLYPEAPKGPTRVTPDSALVFSKKGAPHKQEAGNGEGTVPGQGGEARSLLILLLSTWTTALYLTHAVLRC